MFEGVRNRTTRFFSSFVPAINSRFEILYRQNLLEGFPRIGPDYEIEISRNNLDISNQEFKRQVTEIVLQVQDRYWELQFALQDIQSKEKSLELATTVLENNRVRLEAGVAAQLEVIETQAEVALRQPIRAQFYYREVQDDLVKLMTNLEDPREFPGEIVSSDGLFTPPPVGTLLIGCKPCPASCARNRKWASLFDPSQPRNIGIIRHSRIVLGK